MARRQILHGMVAEFDSPEALLAATKKVRADGYSQIECYTPFPVHGLSEATGFKDLRVPWCFFFLGIIGGLSGLALETYTMVVDYPINVGSKPLFSLASFFPPLYELTILFSAVGGTIFMMGFNGLPRPHHPIFAAPGFERATQDRFFLCIESSDPKFDEDDTGKFLKGLEPLSVSSVEEDK